MQIMIVQTLKMCTGDAGPEQSLVLFLVCLILCMLKMFLMHLLCRLLHFPAKYRYALHQGTLKFHELLKDDIESVLASPENINFKY